MTGEGQKASKFELDVKSTVKSRGIKSQNYRKKCDILRPRERNGKIDVRFSSDIFFIEIDGLFFQT